MKSGVSKKLSLKNFGIGFNCVKSMYNSFGYNLRKKNIILKSKQKKNLSSSIKIYTFSGILQTKINRAIKFYTKLHSYRGTRHKYHYPVRGQRTHTNAKTQKKRLTVMTKVIENNKTNVKAKQKTIKKKTIKK